MIGESTIFTVERAEKESERVYSIIFKEDFKDLMKVDARSGQFIMVWIPRVDEKPYSVVDNSPLKITFSAIGPFGERLSKMRKDDKLGIRGPIGRGFDLDIKGRALLVAGGAGIAPLRLLEKELKAKKREYGVVLGARTKAHLPKWENGKNYFITTDDGTAGEKGFATMKARQLLEKTKYERVYACGPEKMMALLLEILKEKKIKGEFSLERYMKCGLGLCAQCAINGMRVCVDGPVFKTEEIMRMDEFGKVRRDATGTKEKL